MGAFPNANGAAGQFFELAWRWKEIDNVCKACVFKYAQAFLLLIRKDMPGIGYITTNSFDYNKENLSISTDESVCGLLFDISGFYRPFDNFPLLQHFFGDSQTNLINNLAEAEMYGLCEEEFMGGLPYYHIKQYYNYIGADAPLYICFTSDNSEWSAVESMQLAANGRLFQIGIWTSLPLWQSSDRELLFTDLIGNLESAAEILSGKVGQSTLHNTPISLIVSASTKFSNSVFAIQDAPDATALNSPKVSICLAQNNSDEVVAIQARCPNKAPVGCIGIVMACLHLAYAEENIGYVSKFNLNKNDDFNNIGVYFNNRFINASDITYTVGNFVAENGYILPCTYEGKIAEYFFSGDPTASNGDYNHISNNRVIHKCRRAMVSALLPYINDSHTLDVSTGDLSEGSKTLIITDILNSLEAALQNPLGQAQINGKSVEINKNGKILEDDVITVKMSIDLFNHNNVINEKDDFVI